MKALVKSKAEPGLWLEDVPEPEVGINDVLIRILKTAICGTDVHIYNWDDWAAADHPRAHGHRPRVRRRDRRRRVPTSRTSSPANSSAARGTSSAAAAATAWPAAATSARTPAASASTATAPSPSTSCIPMTNVWGADRAHPAGRARLLRSAGQRRPHRAVLRRAGRGRADHRRRPDRLHGGRHRAPRRRAPRRGHRRATTTAWSWRGGWAPRWPSIRASEHLRDVQRELGMNEGFDVGLEMSGSPAAPARHDRQHVPRRQDRPAGHPAARGGRSTGTRSSSTA